MSTLSQIFRTLSCLAVVVVLPAAAQTQADPKLGLGAPVTPQELRTYFAIQPDGRTLPPGRGTPSEGQTVYHESCAACHGDHLEGNLRPGIGGDRLIGGRGSLASPMPVKTVESYWPYATTLFDYTTRASSVRMTQWTPRRCRRSGCPTEMDSSLISVRRSSFTASRLMTKSAA